MRIERDQQIGKLPAIDVRRFMRRHRDWVFARESMNDSFPGISDYSLDQTWRVFLLDGYVKFWAERDGRLWYELTIKGNALAQATAAKPISRRIAEKRLQQFMERVKQVNENNVYAFRIGRVALFGSLLSEISEVNDIDLAVQLEPRQPDMQVLNEHSRKRVEEARTHGKEFRTYSEQLLWPKYEIYHFLKARSRVFSLHEIEELSSLGQNEFKMLLSERPAKREAWRC